MARFVNVVCFVKFALLGYAVGLMSDSTCYDTARRSSSVRRLGGWFVINNPASDSTVRRILRLAVNSINKEWESTNECRSTLERDSNGMLQGVESYRQVVNGLNYCNRFQVRIRCLSETPETNATMTMMCDTLAFIPVSELQPHLVGNVTCS